MYTITITTILLLALMLFLWRLGKNRDKCQDN